MPVPEPTTRMYSLMLASEHRQGLHEEDPHKMCRSCNPVEAALLDRLDDERA